MVVVLCSGGVDSAALLWLARDGDGGRPAPGLGGALFVDYGQPAAAEERAAALLLCAEVGCDLRSIAVPMLLGEMIDFPGHPGARVVPHRNLLLIGYALQWATSICASAVWFGATLDDEAEYIDCRGTFVGGLNAALNAAPGFRPGSEPDGREPARYAGPVVAAPFVWWSKPRVVEYARRAGVPLGLAWSCYTPREGGPCGSCNSCTARASAMAARRGEG